MQIDFNGKENANPAANVTKHMQSKLAQLCV